MKIRNDWNKTEVIIEAINSSMEFDCSWNAVPRNI